MKIIQEKISDYADICSLLGPKVVMVTGEGQTECTFVSDKKAENLTEGKVLRILREGLGFGQQDVAEFLKVDRVTIGQIEKGTRKLKLEEAKMLGEFFDLGDFNIFLML